MACKDEKPARQQKKRKKRKTKKKNLSLYAVHMAFMDEKPAKDNGVMAASEPKEEKKKIKCCMYTLSHI